MVGGATAEAIFAAWMGRLLGVWYDFFLGLCGLWKLGKVIWCLSSDWMVVEPDPLEKMGAIYIA